MSADILALPGVTAPAKPVTEQPVPDVVEALERYLEQACKGEIQAIGVAIVRAGGDVTTYFGGSRFSGNLLLAAMAQLQHDFCAHRHEWVQGE